MRTAAVILVCLCSGVVNAANWLCIGEEVVRITLIGDRSNIERFEAESGNADMSRFRYLFAGGQLSMFGGGSLGLECNDYPPTIVCETAPPVIGTHFYMTKSNRVFRLRDIYVPASGSTDEEQILVVGRCEELEE